MSSSPFNQSRPFRFCFHPLSVTALSLLWGGGGFCWSQSQLSPGEGRVAWTSCQLIAGQRPPCKVPAAKQQQVGVQYLAQGHFHMQLSSARGSWDLPITSRPALPAPRFCFSERKDLSRTFLFKPLFKPCSDVKIHRNMQS